MSMQEYHWSSRIAVSESHGRMTAVGAELLILCIAVNITVCTFVIVRVCCSSQKGLLM